MRAPKPTYEPVDYQRAVEKDDYRAYLRFRAERELLFLAKFILGYSKISEEWHRDIADCFVVKDPIKPIELQDPVYKKRIILMPRLTYKTTFNIADSVQWIIDFPDVAIMVMTAANSDDAPLADAFVEEVGSHFYTPEGEDEKLLTVLYPAYRLDDLPKKGKFTTPARRRYRRDPTIRAVSIEQSLSGWHPDIIKSEDVQDNRNSQTPASLKKVRKNFYINLKMLPEWGYLDETGTRYGPADLYGHQIAKLDSRTKLLWKPAYLRKAHALKMEEWELTEKDVVLQFPQLLPWAYLQAVRVEDENSFLTQYMNKAEGAFKPTFELEALDAAKVEPDHVPLHGTTHMAWRCEYGNSKNDACAVGIEENGRMFIVELFAGALAPTARAKKIVTTAKKWETHRVSMEETPGARTMAQHVYNAALELEWRVEIQWTPFLQDATEQALFIKSAEPPLLSGRLRFSEEIPDVTSKFQTLYQYGMSDEIELPLALAQISSCLPTSIAAPDFDAGDDERWEAYMHQDAQDRVFGRGRYEDTAPPASEVEEEVYTPQTDTLGLTDIMPGLNG